jgi:hypothetical protein
MPSIGGWMRKIQISNKFLLTNREIMEATTMMDDNTLVIFGFYQLLLNIFRE